MKEIDIVSKIRLFLFCIILNLGISNAACGASVNTSSIKTISGYPNFYIIDHPLIQQKLTVMRDKKTEAPEFRQMLDEIAMLMGYEITRNLETIDFKVETPITKTIGKKLKEEVIIAPILRAGLVMAGGLHKLIPSANISHIGLYRDPVTKKPVEYLFKHPKITNQLFIVVDPMLATGNSAVYGVQKLIDAGVLPDRIIFMALVAAPEGIKNFSTSHPEVKVYIAALDQKLNDHAYIVPGLGDAGDRLFGTK